MTTENIYETVQGHDAAATIGTIQGSGASIKATKPADARPSIDLAAPRDLPIAGAGCCGGTGCC